MRRTLFGLAMVALAVSVPQWCLAGEQEDKDAAQQIAQQLRDSGKVQNYSIGVKYKDGTAWLAGQVTSEAQMQAALQVVSDMAGIKQIVNNLEVAKTKTRKKKAAPGSNVSQASARMPMPSGTATTPGLVPQGATMQAAPPAPTGPSGPQPQVGRNGTKVFRGVPQGYSQLQPPPMVEPRQMAAGGQPLPAYNPAVGAGVAPARFDQPNMPNYAWPAYAASPNYAAVTYPRQYSATAWPFIGPFYPYPQVPMGWRKVSLEWDDGWWFLDFQDRGAF
jgi:hypothetical protein